MQKNYQLYLSLGTNVGLGYSIVATKELSELEMDLLKTYLARSFQRDKLHHADHLIGRQPIIIGPNLRHMTSESAKRVEAVQSSGLTMITQIEQFKVYLNGTGTGKIADKMLEKVFNGIPSIYDVAINIAKELPVPFLIDGENAIRKANSLYEIGLTDFDITQVIIPMFKKLRRNPTVSELFTVAVVNSEHGRHHTMNAIGIINGTTMPHTLFELIKEPFIQNGETTAVGFKDNSSALQRFEELIWMNSRIGYQYIHNIYSAESHNFPTGIEAFHGAITGIDGEERDIWGMGEGAQLLFLAAGYAFGNLEMSRYKIPGERKIYIPFPATMEKPLDIAMKATKGVAMGGNETGYPTNIGYTRSFGDTDLFGQPWSFWKPQLFAGAAGYVFTEHLKKSAVAIGMKVYMIGGPAYLIGKGGSQSSSVMQGQNSIAMDWKGVQRGNPFISRKLAEVLQRCVERGLKNPIVSVHDQGAGGIGNVLTELVAPLGALLDIAKVTLGDPTLSHSDIWTAEYQERMAMVIRPGMEDAFEEICRLEKINCECLGEITGTGRIVVTDSRTSETIIDLPLEDILGSVPKMTITDTLNPRSWSPTIQLPKDLLLRNALITVLQRIETGSKDWHLRYKDHSVGGKTVVHQYAGPGQLPINDYALSLISQHGNQGALVSIGEQPIITIMNPTAGVRMSILECLANSAGVVKSDSALQANEMVATKLPGEYARVYAMLSAAKEMALALGLHFNGGKDSTSMAVTTAEGVVKSPPSFIVSNFANVTDVAKHVPAYFRHPGKSRILAINLSGSGHTYRLGASPFLTAFETTWTGKTPDVDDIGQVTKVLAAVEELVELQYITACHDTIGDGLLVSVLEMTLAGGCGATIAIDTTNTKCDDGADPLLAKAFAQEGWLIVEVPNKNYDDTITVLQNHGVLHYENIGYTTQENLLCNHRAPEFSHPVLKMTSAEMWNAYNQTSIQLKKERIGRAEGDKKLVSQEQVFWTQDKKSTKQRVYADFGKLAYMTKQHTNKQYQAKALVLRAEGSNGQEELGFMFESAGFKVTYANMEELLSGKVHLKDFQLLLLPGGFSFGDLFGSGVAWAMQFKHSFLWQDLLDFIARPDTLIFGVCNGYQALNELDIMFFDLDAEVMPRLIQNDSHLFEHHLSYLTIPRKTNVVFLKDMEGWILPVYCAHGEGHHYFPNTNVRIELTSDGRAPIRFANADGKKTQAYPCNPNGSFHGIAGMASPNGRIFGMMPHPERTLLTANLPYIPYQWEGKLDRFTPWIMMAHNAYAWCLKNKR